MTSLWMEEQWLAKGWQHNLFLHPQEHAHMECVLVEMRPRHPYLGGVLRNFSCMFPNAKMTVVHDARDTEYVRDECLEGSCAVRRIPLHLPDNARFSIWDYCSLMTTADFWELFSESKRVLIYQTDTGVRKNRILRYLEYSYVGAPWGTAPPPLDASVRVGNGGLSLRDPRLMKQVCVQYPYASQGIEIEDLYFSHHVAQTEEAAVPDADVAASFSMEHVLHPDPMSFHQIYQWQPPSVLDPLLDHCDPVCVSHNIDKIVDVWVEAPSGRQWSHPDLKPWLEAGIGTKGLVIPEDSLVPIGSHGLESAGMKLCIQWKTKDEGMMKNVRFVLDPTGRVCREEMIS